MKIIITSHTYYPNNDGVQFVTEYLAEGLVKKGNDVTIITNLYPDKTSKEEEIYNGVKILRINAYTKHTIHHGDKKNYISLIKKLASENDIMINVCTQCATTDWILKELDSINIPKILYLHSIWDFKYKIDDFSSLKNICSKVFSNIRWKIYYRTNSKYLKKYNVVTQLHKMDYSYDFFKNKLGIESVIIENAAEKSFFEKDDIEKIDVPDKYIINVSNYLKRKNQEKAVKLFLKSNIPDNWELVLIGSAKNNYYEKIVNIYKKYKENNGSKKIRFLYNIPRNQISTYVKKSSLYFMTSKWEAFPISLTESMAAGIPFISSNVGIVKYLPGGVVCNNDKEYMFWLEEFTCNDELRKQFGIIGKSKALLNYSVEEKVKQLEQILKNQLK